MAEHIESSAAARRPRPERPLSRRLVVLGAGAAGIAGAGLVASRFVAEPPPIAPVVETPAIAAKAPANVAPTSGPAPTVAPPVVQAASPAPTRIGATTSIPSDMAIVTSPRLPLHGVAPDQALPLIRGGIANWQALGSPLDLPVELLAVAGETMPGVQPIETFPDYESLATALATRPGAVALANLAEVDFRVNVLVVGEEDPLLSYIAIEAPAIRVGMVGDVVPGRNVHAHMVQYSDFTRPFAKVAAQLQQFDFTIANLEGNLSDNLTQSTDPHSTSFVSSTQMIAGFQLAGIDAVSLANNHTVYNNEGWGTQGLTDTIAALDAGGIGYFGAGATLERARAPWIAEANGLRLAFLGIDGVTANYEVDPGVANGVVEFDAGATETTPGTNPYASSQFIPDIGAAAAAADIVIPYFHMGAEYISIPTVWAANGARAAAQAGATVVVTNHPHVIQGMETYQGTPIIYSLGNFILDQMWGVEVRSGYILELVLQPGRVLRVRCHPTEIEDFHQPRLMTQGESANLMNRFWTSTAQLAARG